MQVTKGFCNWKNATVSFRNHETSACHAEAVEAIITLPSSTIGIGELLSKQHAIQKLNNRHALHEILVCVKYLCRQGLPLRGDKDESDGNFIQLLKMKAEVDSKLTEWLKQIIPVQPFKMK